MFPCKVSWIPAGTPVGFFQVPMEISHIIHSCCAAIFFTLIAINSIFQFTQSGGAMTVQKIRRNRIYRTCGWGMIIEILLLSLFGIPWLVKGEAFPFLNDGWHRGGRHSLPTK